MTEAQRAVLEMCRPEVVLAAYHDPIAIGTAARIGLHPREYNPHIRAAEQCVTAGWMEHVRDQDFDQAVYRITPAGADALANQH